MCDLRTAADIDLARATIIELLDEVERLKKERAEAEWLADERMKLYRHEVAMHAITRRVMKAWGN